MSNPKQHSCSKTFSCPSCLSHVDVNIKATGTVTDVNLKMRKKSSKPKKDICVSNDITIVDSKGIVFSKGHLTRRIGQSITTDTTLLMSKSVCTNLDLLMIRMSLVRSVYVWSVSWKLSYNLSYPETSFLSMRMEPVLLLPVACFQNALS